MPQTMKSPAELRNMFGANLRLLSKRYPSISELARQLGINRTQFNRYLSGESFPRPDVLSRICAFFDVDARILLEPVESLATKGEVLNGPFLRDFVGWGANDLPEETFPTGFYSFSRRSFIDEERFVVGTVRIFREGRQTFLRGFEAREAMQQQGLPADADTREFRGVVTRQENGVAILISRRHSMTTSFNFLSRVTSFENNFWDGYVTRTVRESGAGTRVTRMVYEYLGPFSNKVLNAARSEGFVAADKLTPFHRKLLKIDEPFN